MSLAIAIQSDHVEHVNGEHQSFSERWTTLALDRGMRVVPVDVYTRNCIPTIAECDAFMWRSTASAHQRLYAQRLLYAVEEGLGLPVFPSLATSWYFEDKLAQHAYFSAIGAPIPKTVVCWSRQDAERFCDATDYPFVLKLARGYQAVNVRMVRSRDDAQFYIEELFGPGVVSLAYRPAPHWRRLARRLRMAAEVLRGQYPHGPTRDAEVQYGHFYAQEFVPGNDWNIRVTVIGERAFVFRMFNRPGDFRASLLNGSIDWDPVKVGMDAVRLAWQISRWIGSQTAAFDIIRRDSRPLVVELTLNYASWAVRDCPGHWRLHGDPDTSEPTWVDGSTEPADAIFEDFIEDIQRRRAHARDVVRGASQVVSKRSRGRTPLCSPPGAISGNGGE